MTPQKNERNTFGNILKLVVPSIFLILLGVRPVAFAQNIGINSTGATPASSAMLDIVATDKGLLIPRVALTATNAAGPITSPATSLLVYNTATAGSAPNNVTPGYYYWNGSAWVTFATSTSGSWTLDGNNLTALKSLGTTSAYDLPFITTNTERMRISADGDVAIGTSSIDGDQKLLVDAGTTQTAIGAIGSVNDYLEISVQNSSNGGKASSDIVATANNGTDNSVYVDMGINSAGYSNGASNILNGGNLAYLYSNADHLKIGNGTPGKALVFFTNPSTGQLGTNTANGEERIRILESGNVGIGTPTPNSTLSINGSLTMTYRSGTGSYTVLATDYVVINTGGSTPTWTLPAANTCSGRIYRLVNQGTTNVTLSQSVTTASGTTTTTLPFGATGNYEILSDGSVWRKIN
jgi:hypothetical protein